MSLLEARNLSCGYEQQRVIEELSLSIHAGEVLVLLGPNGSGKTTLLRALSRLLPPERGSVLLDDQEIWRLSAAQFAKRLAHLPQAERRDSPLLVEEAVSLGRAPHRGWYLPFGREDRKIVDQVLQATELISFRKRPVTELSGGEWKRVVLARALAQQASVLLLDEPTSALDLRYQFEFLRLIRSLAERDRLAVVLTLHDLNLAAVYGHRLALLADRRLIASGSAGDVLTAETISRVYGIAVTVTPHPVYGTPLVAPLTSP